MKKMFTVIALLTATISMKAQDFYHTGGFTYMVITYNQEYTVIDGTDEVYENSGYLGAPAIMYNPMLVFEMNGSMSFIAAAYPSLGFSFNSSGEGNYLAFQLPLAAELFFGDIEDFGGYAGLGLNYGLIGTGYVGGSVGGLEISGGGQVYLAERLFKLRVAYTAGLIKKQDPALEYNTDRRGIINVGITYQL